MRNSANKRITIAVLLLSLLLASWMVLMIYQRTHDAKFSPKELPSVQLFELVGGAPYFISKNNEKILVFFKSDCPFCEQTANEIINSEYRLENVEVIFISSELPDRILDFSLNHHSDVITYLCDETTLFSKALKVNKYPAIFIYSGQNQKLTKRFVGAVPLEQILQALSNE